MSTATPTPSLVSLAQGILTDATALQEELDKQQLPQPNFAADGRRNYHDIIFNAPASDARSKLIDSARMMLRLAMGPAEILHSTVMTERTGVMVLRAIWELNLAEAVPLDGDISIDALAAAAGVHPIPLQRLIRFAYTMYIFQEPVGKPDYVAHTSVSAAIPAFSPYLWLQLSATTKTHSASFHFADAMKNWPKSPLELSDPQGRDFWAILQQDEPDGKGMDRFSAAMNTYMKNMHGPSNAHFTNGFDWAALGTGVVVDIGGGNGHNAVGIAKSFPQLEFIVQDLPKNEGPASELLGEAGVEPEGRVRFQPHDFFNPQPGLQPPPKAYMLSRVLHDWTDEDCVRILAPLLPGLRQGVRLLVVERVLPDRPGEVSLRQEAVLRTLDLLMFTFFGGGCERSRGQWELLFAKADGDLKVKSIGVLPESELSILEVGF
ncbi:O-methyltransferase-domain-containing protein [Lasiosphaeria hispida]|uniref:O-methyltransferase-domain-containing protein n=1 Tax=Lasiosphaeria hispida TaxID=260671 RepID=A0AAJ0MCL2_9PEZI|nr:O-methyltransferase-domain-containing protein [Lasiosphaeria hispida]